MASQKPLADYSGVLKELTTGDILAPAYLGTGTPTGLTQLYGDGSWQNPALGIVAASAAINTTETILQTLTLTTAQLIAGRTIRITAYGSCTSTAANVSTFRVRMGVNGSTADGIVASFTTTAATSGTAIPFEMEFILTIRTLGSTGTIAGMGSLSNNGVTGISSTAAVVGGVTSSTLNTTVSEKISLSYVSAATTTTTTFQLVLIEPI
jgi:hypothetical protein